MSATGPDTEAGDLAAANHILYDQGLLDAFGHVSVRRQAGAEAFRLSRNRAPALVRPGDILTFDLEGNVQAADNPAVYLERFIHAAIYRARPDVNAVVHSHAASVLPFGVVGGAALCPICHMSGFIRRGTPVFEIRECAGAGSDLLIRSIGLGARLAERLADHPLVLMRGHGMTVVGANLREAVFRSVYVEANARIQLAAGQLGPATFLTEAEAAAADAANAGQIGRAWEFWSLRATRAVETLQGQQPGSQS